MQPKVWLILTVTVLLLWTGASWIQRPREQAPIKVAPAKKKDVVKVPKDFSWNNLSKSDLRGMSSNFDSHPNHLIPAFDTMVADKETVLTQGYESTSGVFVFSSITPTWKKNNAGKDVVQVEVKTFNFSVGGDYKVLNSSKQEVVPGKNQDFISMSRAGIHTVHLDVGKNNMYPMINIKAKEYINPIK